MDDEINDINYVNRLLYFLNFKQFRTYRNLLFEQNDDESLFELILKTPRVENYLIIKSIWIECELWRKENILVTPNLKGKLPIEFVIESDCKGNLFSFLVYDFDGESDTVTRATKKYFLVLKNEQFKTYTGKSLFQHFYSIIGSDCHEIIFSIIKKILEEMKEIQDIEMETSISEVLTIENEIFRYKILEILIHYWNPHSIGYSQYKTNLSNMSPFFKPYLSLRENNEEEFCENFDDYVNQMKIIHGKIFYKDKMQPACNSLLEYALKKGLQKSIEKIIECPLVDPNSIKFSSEIFESDIDSQMINFLMSKLLQIGFYLGPKVEGNIPIDWISTGTMIDFLDSRVQDNGKCFVLYFTYFKIIMYVPDII